MDDEKSFEDLFKTMSGTLYGYFYSNKIKLQDVHDLVNETFMLAWKYRHTLRDLTKIKSWILSIARNVFISYKKDEKRVRNYNFLGDFNHSELVSEKRENGHNDDIEFALEAINKLPENYRNVFVLFYVDGRSISEISQIMGLTESNCRVMLHRARKKISHVLERGGKNGAWKI